MSSPITLSKNCLKNEIHIGRDNTTIYECSERKSKKEGVVENYWKKLNKISIQDLDDKKIYEHYIKKDDGSIVKFRSNMKGNKVFFLKSSPEVKETTKKEKKVSSSKASPTEDKEKTSKKEPDTPKKSVHDIPLDKVFEGRNKNGKFYISSTRMKKDKLERYWKLYKKETVEKKSSIEIKLKNIEKRIENLENK